MTNKPTREQILALLDSFVRQRAGLEFGNYGDVKAYRAEQRSITRDLHDYRAIRSAVERSSIGADALLDAFRAFSGRLSISEAPPKHQAWCATQGILPRGAIAEHGPCNCGAQPRFRIDYCTGQYFPTEYRRAACAVLSQALWDYRRDDMPAPDAFGVSCLQDGGGFGPATSKRFATREEAEQYAATVAGSRSPLVDPLYRGKSAGDFLRYSFRREFGARLARRWFD